MYNSLAGMGQINILIGLIVLITFFLMAFRLRKIKQAVESLIKLEYLKPESQKNVKCEK